MTKNETSIQECELNNREELRSSNVLLQEGPRVTVNKSCSGCRWHSAERYQVQGDSGYDHYCTHGGVKRDTGSFTWKTPDWCPFDRPAVEPSPVDDAPASVWAEALQDDIYYASQIDPYIARLRATLPPCPAPLDHRAYLMAESGGGRYRLVIGFESNDDMNAAHDWLIANRGHGPTKGVAP